MSQALTTSRFSMKRLLGLLKSVALLSLLFSALSLSACSKSYPNCDNDKNCRSRNEVCVDGKCRQCATNAHCQAIDACLSCQGNECVRAPGCCKSDLDCPSGRCWKVGGASAGVCGGECQSAEHCGAGMRCDGGKCVPDACDSDASCPSGQRCVSGSCVAGCTLEPVLFDFNEQSIRLDQETIARANADCIRSGADVVRVEGHCDERGSDEYNLALGQRRANALLKQYKALGVPASQLKGVVSFGEERPACNDNNEACWQQNRRAETVKQ